MDLARVIAILNLVTLVVIMFAMGLQVSLAELGHAARRTGIVLAGLAANFLVIPILTVVLLRLFQSEPLVAAGFLILAVCPGAPVAPPLVRLAKGDLPMAVGLMVLLCGATTLLAPLLLGTLLSRIAPSEALLIDRWAIVRTLLLAQIVPLGLGLAVHQAVPQLAHRAEKTVSLAGSLLLLTLTGLILVAQFDTLAAIHLRGWAGMSLLLLVSLAIGWFCGGADRSLRATSAVTTAVRNTAVALVIASASFAGTAAVTAVVAYGLLSLGGASVFAAVMGRVHANRDA